MKARFARRAHTLSARALQKKKCSRMTKQNMMSKAVWAHAMENVNRSAMTLSSAPAAFHREAREEMRRSTETASATFSRLQRMMSDEADDEVSDARDMEKCLQVSVRADKALDDLEAELEKEGASMDVSDDKMAKLLASLRDEPKDDKGREAKFKLYEEFQETIADARKALFKFWEDCKKSFGSSGDDEDEAAAAVKAVEADLKSIDHARNLGFPDMRGDVWFVFHMAKKVDKNNTMLDRLLNGIERKLDILSKQDDCPICLEELDDAPVVLGCCHKVCSECWANWVEMQNANAFCPLCRHNDFLGSVMAGADDGDDE